MKKEKASTKKKSAENADEQTAKKKKKFNKVVFRKVVLSLVSVILVVAIVMGGFMFFGGKIDENKGFDKSNNGYDLNSDEVNRLISVVPTENQVKFSDLGYYSFIHYGMNTFTGKEWGDGTEDEKTFNPEKVDTDQWAKVIAESGSKAIIFTAKHHDGFCLFQTEYTEHSIKNSPYQDGKGDIVKELAESCKKYGLQFGIYLSPWDRNSKLYGTDAYNDYFVNQLTELCTNYGEIFCFWFDGAKGEDAPDFEYDWNRYFETIHKLQPNAVIANCGDDVRWIGNEAGIVRKAEWSVVTEGTASIEETMKNSQKTEAGAKELQEVVYDAKDIGSRELVKGYKDLKWYPAESDVSIHYDWFYNDKSRMRTAKQLAKIYFGTVGGNASLLLNVPPSKNGVIEDKDVKLLQDFKAEVDKAFTTKLKYTATAGEADATDFMSYDGNSWMLCDGQSTVTFKLDEKAKVKTIVLQEDIAMSQRVEAFEIYAKVPGGYQKIYSGTVIGSKKIVRLSFPFARTTDEIKIVFTQSRSNPFIRSVELYS